MSLQRLPSPSESMKTTPRVEAADEVEVVDLRGLRPDRVSQYLEVAAAVNSPRVKLLGHDAEEIAALWNELPPGQQDRCHVPPFGLRFFSGAQLILEASVCWDCSNIFGVADGSIFSFEFDASAPASKALLTRLLSATR